MTVADSEPNPEWLLPFRGVQECLTWIRVVARQYWVGVLLSGSHSVARGSIINCSDGSYTNFGASRMPLSLSPLTYDMWYSIARTMASGNVPAIPELLFCDALISFRDADYLQAVIRLAVTCELELNAFIDDLLSLQNSTVRKLYDAARVTFSWKLRNMPEILGAERYQDHDTKNAETLCKLYELRGAAVHRAELRVDERNETTGQRQQTSVGFSHVSTFIFAVDDFLRWAKEQRGKVGLASSVVENAPVKYTIGTR